MKNLLLIVERWNITVDNDYVNSLDSKINDVKNKIGMSNDDSDDNSNDSNFKKMILVITSCLYVLKV